MKTEHYHYVCVHVCVWETCSCKLGCYIDDFSDSECSEATIAATEISKPSDDTNTLSLLLAHLLKDKQDTDRRRGGKERLRS